MSSHSTGVDPGRYDDLCVQLENVAEALVDRSMDQLRRAIDDGATKRPPEEKHLARAQRSIDKAIQILRSLDDTPSAGR